MTAEERKRRIQAAIDRDGAEVVWARLMRVLNDKDFDQGSQPMTQDVAAPARGLFEIDAECGGPTCDGCGDVAAWRGEVERAGEQRRICVR